MIKRCCQHDRVAQQKLYETYAPKMLGICMRYVKDYHVACDLMHDGFITVYSKIGDFRSEGSFEGWMRRIFVNTALGYLRKANVLNGSVPVDGLVQLDNHDVTVFERMEAAELRRCIDRLPDGYRVVLNLFAIEGYSHKEIAEMLAIPEETVRTRLFRARGKLKTTLKEVLQYD